ncbi:MULTISPECIES: dephospho-CoA kinase [unclassified Bifidobacterium]|uniref:dephospho-CoA kinase n=1 Tax=unclassified Bifidobacterium TaxID=2608897 RepID=UPI00226B3890|nr:MULTISPECIES: dephospho-CoA kinase [unclassified Bifidobacterium]MCX8647352.1 dephospho-CoA kinase [Bifidobacterium sp. B4107]MCX8651531.1 dephospho-CoA kinase [Bifidobacterium sp. B4111]MCX8657962.1 dephospho-CoA kinase [Bifidobacterium sp. B4114]MCX8687255.1 dephospho-CoA kinase [Bifidobacterium sp. B4142]
MIRVGLTGGIAAGKSTVAARLAQDGARVIDYDRLSHEVIALGGPGVRPVLERFGLGCGDGHGGVDRSALAARVFGGPTADQDRRDLDDIIHPLVYDLAAKAEQPWLDGSEVVVHEVPLLTEVGSTIPFHFDRVLVVEAPSQVRIARMVNQRHMTPSQAVERIGSQSSSSSRRAQADLLVDGSQPIEQMFEFVDRIYKELQVLAQESSHSD